MPPKVLSAQPFIAYHLLLCACHPFLGTLRRKIVAGSPQTPPANRVIEAVTFLHGPCHHVFIAAGADQVLRMYDSFDGTVYAEVPAKHCPGESVTSVLVEGRNRWMVTGDGEGFLRLWKLPPGLNGESLRAGRAALESVRIWRGHEGGRVGKAGTGGLHKWGQKGKATVGIGKYGEGESRQW